MWYFTWILGIGLAVAFAILNAMWLEVHESNAAEENPPDSHDPSGGRSSY